MIVSVLVLATTQRMESLHSIITGIGRHLRDAQQSNDPRLLDKEKGCFPKLYNALGRQFSERLPLPTSERLPLALYIDGLPRYT